MNNISKIKALIVPYHNRRSLTKNKLILVLRRIAILIMCLPVMVSGAGNDFHSQTGKLVAAKDNMTRNHETGFADQRRFISQVKGRVDYVGGGIMIVIGQYVDITHNPTFTSKMKDIAGIHNIPIDAMADVSGYSDTMGNIIATKVILEDHMVNSTDVMQVEGTIQELDLIGNSFMIGDQLIYFGPSSEDFTLENGMNVAVHMSMDSAGDLHAVKIEKDISYYNEDEDVKISGRVKGNLNIDGTFMINGQNAKLAENVKYENGLTSTSIVNGAILKVEGYLDATGKLIVYDVGAQHAGHGIDAPGGGSLSTI